MPAIAHLIFAAALVMFGAALFAIDFQPIAAAVNLVTTTETLVATGVALSLPSTSGKAVISCDACVTLGSSTTALVLKVYRGNSISGAAAFTRTFTMPTNTGGPQYTISAKFADVLSMTTQAQYCFSITQTAATTNGSVTAAGIGTQLISG